MNILSFDIEEWFVEETLYGNRTEKYAEYNQYLFRILSLLERCGIKATFFCVGGLVPKYNYVIREIEEKGHEIGCHSNQHHFLNKMTYDAVLEDTKTAIDSIEQVIGRKVLSYRAPAFSINESNKWTFDILAECGIERDASVFPTARDFGGFDDFGVKEPCIISSKGHSLKEFPICMASFFGRNIAYSGGGYFRLFPSRFIKSQIDKSDYTMSYFHIGDLLPESKSIMTRREYEEYFRENGSFVNRFKRFIKANLGKKGAFSKMTRIIEQSSFVNLAVADTLIDWDNAPHITL